MSKSIIIVFCLSWAMICFSCGGNNSNHTHRNSVFDADGSVPTDFMDFYMKFHQDSLYQMGHIQFPLKGMPAMAIDLSQDSINNYYWQEENWKVHKPFMGNETEYMKEFITISDNLISEFIVEKQMGYGMERRFSKIAGRWNLIYYMDMNKLSE